MLGFEINLGVKRNGVDLRIISDKKGKLSRLPKAKTYVYKPGNEVFLVNALAKAIVDNNLVDATATGIAGLEDCKKSLESYTPVQAAEVCGIPAEEIVALATDYAKADKALIILPLGLGYPGHDKALAQALINLALVAGKIGKEGSGVLIMGEKNNSQGAVDMGIYPAGKGKGASAIIDACSAGTIKALYVIGENPVVSYPNRKKITDALDKVGFLVVQDLFLTETAEKANVVLPACSFAEKEGTFTSVGRIVQHVQKAIKPVGQSRSDFDILNGLSGLLGGATFSDPGKVFAEIAGAVNATPVCHTISLARRVHLFPLQPGQNLYRLRLDKAQLRPASMRWLQEALSTIAVRCPVLARVQCMSVPRVTQNSVERTLLH